MALPVVVGYAFGALLASVAVKALGALVSALTKFGTVVAIPLLWNMQIDWARYGMDQLTGFMAGAGFSLDALAFSGIAGWALDCLRFQDCVGLLLATVQVLVIQRIFLK